MDQRIDSFVGSKIMAQLTDNLKKMCEVEGNQKAVAMVVESASRMMGKAELIAKTKPILMEKDQALTYYTNTAGLIKTYLDSQETRNRSMAAEELFNHGFRQGATPYVVELIRYGGKTKSFINVHKNNEDAFRWALRTDNMDLVNLLLDNQQVIGGIDLHANNDQAFRECCVVGNLVAAQWLYDYAKTKGSPINLGVNKNEAFHRACTGGYLELAQWIYGRCKEVGKPIDLSEGDYRYLGDTFKAYGPNKTQVLQIAQWLSSM